MIHSGEQDAVRIYSVKMLKAKLESVGLKVEVFSFREEKTYRSGLKKSGCCFHTKIKLHPSPTTSTNGWV